jgi:hypothetical protein
MGHLWLSQGEESSLSHLGEMLPNCTQLQLCLTWVTTPVRSENLCWMENSMRWGPYSSFSNTRHDKELAVPAKLSPCSWGLCFISCPCPEAPYTFTLPQSREPVHFPFALHLLALWTSALRITGSHGRREGNEPLCLPLLSAACRWDPQLLSLCSPFMSRCCWGERVDRRQQPCQKKTPSLIDNPMEWLQLQHELGLERSD